jgi:hypothetical protein
MRPEHSIATSTSRISSLMIRASRRPSADPRPSLSNASSTIFKVISDRPQGAHGSPGHGGSLSLFVDGMASLQMGESLTWDEISISITARG